MSVGAIPDSKVHGANMRPIWGQQGPGGPHVGPMNFAIWDVINYHNILKSCKTNSFYAPHQCYYGYRSADIYWDIRYIFSICSMQYYRQPG